MAAELGVPEWIWERLVEYWGQAEAEEYLAASLEPPPRTARLRPGIRGGRPVNGIATAVEIDEVVDGMVVMDPSSVAVGLACEVEPGMAVLDVAAAPGGKTAHIFDQMQGTDGALVGLLVASDRHKRRAVSARSRLQKLGISIPWLVADGRRVPVAPASFDRVLVDAPCTGLGTLRRRPEIRHRLEPDAPARLGVIQRALLAEALRVTRPDGFVVYAVCTVFPEETVEVVADHRAAPPPDLPGRAAGKGWLLGPHLSGGDGMFISIVRP